MTDHGRIREWIELRGGTPAATGAPGSGESSSLVIHFPDTGETDVQQISWEDFFRHFDSQKLELICKREPREAIEPGREFTLAPR